MALTKITGDVIKDSTIAAADMSTTGTANSSTTLHGNNAWTAVSTTGVINIAAADPGTGQTAGNTWFLSGAINVVTPVSSGLGVWTTVDPISEALVKVTSAGTRNAGIRMGGMTGWDEGTQSNKTEEYDGTAWTAGGNLNTARSSMTRAGTQSATMCGGGSNYGGSSGSYSMNNCEEYNGTAWSNVNNLLRGVQDTEGDGTQTAAWSCGGYQHPNNNPTNSMNYDGTTWTGGGTLNTGRQYCNGCGLQTAGLIVAGRHDYSATVEEYDGTSWSAGANVHTALWKSAVFGIQTAAVSASGQRTSPSARLSETQEYNGTAWSTSGNVILGRMTTGAGSQASGLMIAGETTASGNTGSPHVEEYDVAVAQFINV